ncbi:hypothetical protein [Larkinella soli]|uniref:hypothetical protein n=1 Tax=Larkinella soli TaxID=1770527 RepID=UPI000FFC9D56|nr:hypothetical protein [Larkinella soli]
MSIQQIIYCYFEGKPYATLVSSPSFQPDPSEQMIALLQARNLVNELIRKLSHQVDPLVAQIEENPGQISNSVRVNQLGFLMTFFQAIALQLAGEIHQLEETVRSRRPRPAMPLPGSES